LIYADAALVLRDLPVAGGHAPLGEGASVIRSPAETPLGRDSTTIACPDILEQGRA